MAILADHFITAACKKLDISPKGVQSVVIVAEAGNVLHVDIMLRPDLATYETILSKIGDEHVDSEGMEEN